MKVEIRTRSNLDPDNASGILTRLHPFLARLCFVILAARVYINFQMMCIYTYVYTQILYIRDGQYYLAKFDPVILPHLSVGATFFIALPKNIPMSRVKTTQILFALARCTIYTYCPTRVKA